MSKKVKVLVSVLVAVVLLTVGGAAAVMADDEATPTSNTTGDNGLLARVAQNLGITEEELADAFNQARQEMRDEAFIRYLDKAVEKGLITQPEADEIEEWWTQRPESVDRLLPRYFFSKALHSRHKWGAHPGMSEEALNQAMENGLITEQANMIKQRWQSRLESPKQMFTLGHIRQAMRGQQMIAVPMGWHGMRPPELAD